VWHIEGTKQITQLIGALAHKYTKPSPVCSESERLAICRFDCYAGIHGARQREKRGNANNGAHVFCYHLVGINRALSLASTDLQRSQIDNLLNKMSNLIFA
jgi:hypothetical protein